MILDHIGVATNSIEQSVIAYEALGYKAGEIFTDKLQNVKLCFLKKNNNMQIELVEAIDNTSPVIKHLKKNGVSPYHTCYRVNNIKEKITELKKKSFIIISEPKKAIAFDYQYVCFLYHKNIGIIELLEVKE